MNNWTGRSASELIAADPVSAARFIDNRFEAVLKYICFAANPIGEVTHHYYLYEYQGRGLPHFHCLFWVKNASVFGKSSNKEVKNFILKYTYYLPNTR